MIKKPGCCSQCDKEVYEITQRFPQDHPYKGIPMKLGKPLDVHRVSLILTSGTRADLTLCGRCVKSPDYRKIWDKVLKAWALEADPKHRLLVGAGEGSKEKIEEFVLKMKDDVPIGFMTLNPEPPLKVML